MGVQQTLTYGWKGDADSLSQSVTIEAGLSKNVQEQIPAGSSELVVDFDADVSQLKLVYISATKDLTIKTNSSGSPAKTIALTANEPLMWKASDGAANNPFGSTDVTKLYVTNGTGVATDLKIRSLEDPTD